MFSVTSGFLKGPRSENTLVPGISKPKIPLVSYSSCFISQFIHPICWIQGISSAMVYFAFAEFIFSLRDTPLPPLQQQQHQTVLYFYPWIAITVNCNGLRAGKMFLSMECLGAGGRFIHVDWAACSSSCQNQCALLVPKFKFQPGETRKKSCFTSKAPTTSHSPAPVETWKHWLPTQQDGGSRSTPSFHSSPFSLL